MSLLPIYINYLDGVFFVQIADELDLFVTGNNIDRLASLLNDQLGIFATWFLDKHLDLSIPKSGAEDNTLDVSLKMFRGNAG